MNKATLILSTAVLALPLFAFTGVAIAATAHNMEHGTTTKDAYDTQASQHRKQMQMRGHHRRYRRY